MFQRCDSVRDAAHGGGGVLAEAVPFEVHLLTDLFEGDHYALLGVGDEHQIEPLLLLVDFADSEAGAVDGNVAFRNDVRQQVVAKCDLDPQRLAFALELQDFAGLIDVALHEMSRISIVCAHRSFEVHEATDLQVAQICSPQRLWSTVHLEGGRIEGRRGEASAVHGDAATDVGALNGNLAFDLEDESFCLCAVPHLQPCLAVDGDDLTHLFNDAGEPHFCECR
mmetsp:Transcript_95393/g.199583  ORF Transcript_95393/g.199583 Transcript_95393/m.199583 type:complete len:224 (+) Transcript_95393:159-830(+)